MSTDGVPLPLELFVQVCSHLDTNELITATHVSRVWRATLLDTSSLWSELTGVDLTRKGTVERAEAVLARAEGGLTRLSIGFPPDEDAVESYLEGDEFLEVAVHNARLILRAIQRASAGSSLRHLTVSLESIRDPPDSLTALVDLVIYFCEFVATGITHLSLTTNMARLPAGRSWFQVLPNLRHLVISSDDDLFESDDVPASLTLPPNEWDRDGLVPLELERWVVAGGYLRDSAFAPMPCLTTLELLNTTAPYLSAMLDACANSLQRLCLVGTQPEIPPPAPSASVRRVLLPSLRSAHVGLGAPSLWLESFDCGGRFAVETPVLGDVSWGPRPKFGCLSGRGEGEEEYGPSDVLDAALLRQVLTACPRLRRVDVHDVEEDSGAIADCLVAGGGSLEEVVLGNRASEGLIGRLARDLPRLELVAVQRDRVGFVALAHMAQAYLDTSGWAQRPASLTIRVTRPPYAGRRHTAAGMEAGLVWNVQRLAAPSGPSGDPVSAIVASIARSLRPGDCPPACGGILERYGAELGALVAEASALPEEERLGDDASEEDRERQKTFVTGLIKDWVRERMEEDAKAWLREQDGVVLECEEGEDGAAGGSENESSWSNGSDD